jgi:arylsulfatase A
MRDALARWLTLRAWMEKPIMLYRIYLLAVAFTLISSVSAADKPNVIVILTDDHGSVDAGCYGAKDLVTPNLDDLAASGVRFTQFYSAAPVCSPSRASLLTGRYPERCGVPTNVGAGKGLPADEATMAEMFKAAGYATAHIGKWHLGYSENRTPNGQGFDYSFGFMGGCIDNYSHFFYWSGPNAHDLHRNGKEVFHDGEYFPDLMVREAGQFMEKNREQPFFIYFAINTPHYPYQGEPKWLERFKDLPYPRNLYAAFLASTDERIGALIKKVDDLGLRERTIIAFQSDNGHSTEERAHSGGGTAGPYRGAKFSLFEGGIRLPAIISWPKNLPANAVRHQVSHACDWLPTLAELCGVKVINEDLDGKSLVSVLKTDVPSPHQTLHWVIGDGKNPQWAVRHGDWKLISGTRDTGAREGSNDQIPVFLSNLALDISEKKNYADERPEIVEQLRKLHQERKK